VCLTRYATGCPQNCARPTTRAVPRFQSRARCLAARRGFLGTLAVEVKDDDCLGVADRRCNHLGYGNRWSHRPACGKDRIRADAYGNADGTTGATTHGLAGCPVSESRRTYAQKNYTDRQQRFHRSLLQGAGGRLPRPPCSLSCLLPYIRWAAVYPLGEHHTKTHGALHEPIMVQSRPAAVKSKRQCRRQMDLRQDPSGWLAHR
jgi:hypothetical protein